MKPGQKPYDRHSRDWIRLETVNPCNTFIVEFLIRCKIRMDKQRSSQFYCYNLAIQSVKRHPLPIISATQLIAIQGFGSFFVEETLRIIKKHYQRGRLPTPQQKIQDEQEERQSMRLHLQRVKNIRNQQTSGQVSEKTSLCIDSKSIESKDISSFNQVDSKISESVRFIKSLKSQQTYEPSESSQKKMLKSSVKSSKSVYIVANKPYAPKFGCQAFMVLQLLYEYDQHQKGLTKGQLNEIQFDKTYGDYLRSMRSRSRPPANAKLEELMKNQQSIKSWKCVKEKLEVNQYIIFDQADNQLFYLTAKGQAYVKEILEQEQQRVSRRRKSESYQPQEKTMQIKNKNKNKKKYPLDLRKNLIPELQYDQIYNTYTQRFDGLTLLIDKGYLETNYTNQEFQVFMSKIHNIKYEITKLKFGSFMWESQEGQIINAIASIVDFSLFDEDEIVAACQQLAHLQKVAYKIIIYETKSGYILKKSCKQIICEAKACGFKIHRSESESSSLTIIKKYHSLLEDCQKKKKLVTIADSRQQFESRNQSNNTFLLNNIFFSQLCQLPTMKKVEEKDKRILSKNLKGLGWIFQNLGNNYQSNSLQETLYSSNIFESKKRKKKVAKVSKFLKSLLVSSQYQQNSVC